MIDPLVSRLGEVLWIVDVNRQSLDRIVPDIAIGRLAGMFEAAGWQVVNVKYGRRLQELFAQPGGEAVRRRIDTMANEEYQRTLRLPADEVRERLADCGADRRVVERALGALDDEQVRAAFRDLGGHDIPLLLDAFAQADAVRDRPTVIFAFTIKAWRLPIEGHPANHSGLLTAADWESLAGELGRRRCRSVGGVRARRRRGAALPRGRRGARARAGRACRGAGAAGAARPRPRRANLDPADVRPLLHRPRARRPRRNRGSSR